MHDLWKYANPCEPPSESRVLQVVLISSSGVLSDAIL